MLPLIRHQKVIGTEGQCIKSIGRKSRKNEDGLVEDKKNVVPYGGVELGNSMVAYIMRREGEEKRGRGREKERR